MTITGGSALPKDEIDRMVKEAEAHAADDKKRREEAETRNTAEQKVYMTEKFLKDDGDKVSEGTRNEVQTDIDAVKKALEGDDIEAVKSAMTKLDESSLRVTRPRLRQTLRRPAPARQMHHRAMTTSLTLKSLMRRTTTSE